MQLKSAAAALSKRAQKRRISFTLRGTHNRCLQHVVAEVASGHNRAEAAV